MSRPQLDLPVRFRDLEPGDLGDLYWSGSSTHVETVAAELNRSYAGSSLLLVGVLPNGRVVALGGADVSAAAGLAALWMLAVHETLQSLGIGTRLIAALEQRALEHGCRAVRLAVEHDNPRAAALYRRLGYIECGTEVQSWPASGGRTYVTVSTLLQKSL